MRNQVGPRREGNARVCVQKDRNCDKMTLTADGVRLAYPV
jgi:hypothetical protein